MKPVLIDPQTQRRHYADVELENIIQRGNAMPRYLQGVIGSGASLTVPLMSIQDVARAAAILSRLAWEVERIHRLGGPTGTALLQVRVLMKAARKKMAEG
jgi:hypothetical protein